MFQGILYCVVFLGCAWILAKVRSRRVRQAVLLIASYGLYLTMGALVWCSSCHLNGSQFSFGAMAAAKTFRGNPAGGIFVNLVLLGGFKYLPEVAVHFPVTSLQQFSHLALPLGLSFWTFQAMSYLFDLYRGEEHGSDIFRICPVHGFLSSDDLGPDLSYARYTCPIPVRAPSRGRYKARLARIATGVFMMQVAKLLGQGIFGGDGITSGFDRLHQWRGPDVWCLALGYGLQLFFDFAGYSHIAIGAAQAMGFTVPENFARPFASTNASVFWHALAYVAVVLDSGLLISSASYAAT